MRYEVFVDGNVNGYADVVTEGLYCHIHCRVTKTEQVRKLIDHTEFGDISIGVCVPLRDGFGLNKRIPQKRLRGKEHRFSLEPVADTQKIVYYFEEGLPTKVLERLESARLVVEENRLGVIILDDLEASQSCYPV